MTTKISAGEIVGRGNREGATLFQDWYASLANTAEEGGRGAYVFVMGSFNEILKAFDLPIVFPEINSLQTAVRKVAHEYLRVAEDYGYSPDICGYVKADVAVQFSRGKHPMGRIPKPGIAILTNACNTYIKWAEFWERIHQIPVVTIDIPGTRDGIELEKQDAHDFANDQQYVIAQIKELIATCEEVTGTKFDIDKLRENMEAANTLSTSWKRIIELNKNQPSVFNALTDGTVFLGVANGFRGTKEGADYFTRLVEEMEFKAAHGIGAVDDEQYRLAFVGVPCYPIFRRFNEMFLQRGGTYINSTYLWFASGGANRGFEYELTDPINSLAEGVLLSVRSAMDSMFHQDRMLEEIADDYGIDGIVYHAIKSCRTVSTGLADARQSLSERRDIPSLFIESDMMDRRVVSEAQIKNRVDAFFEGLASRRQRADNA
jgi:benzoyl-CoA reductase subunit B